MAQEEKDQQVDAALKRERSVASLAGVIALATTLFAIAVEWLYLTEYGRQRIVIAIAIAVLGAGVAALLYACVVQLCRRGVSAVALLVLLILAPLAIAASTVYPGQVTHAQFGLTVYGMLPLPVLDITVDARGMLWFRDKSHHISIEEVERLLSPETEVLIIGTGWEGLAGVDAEVRALDTVEVRILRAPGAFELYNKYRRQGIRPVLIAHTTC